MAVYYTEKVSNSEKKWGKLGVPTVRVAKLIYQHWMVGVVSIEILCLRHDSHTTTQGMCTAS